MDSARADSMLFYEDCEAELESPSHLEGSEDEDSQKELEEMLYSRVYHESSSIDLPPSAPDTCPLLNINITHVDSNEPSTKLVCGTKEHSISSAVQSHKPSNRSEFNNPSRTTASRYYDVNQDIRNSRPLFVCPADPGQKSNSQKVIKRKQSKLPSVLSSKILARSSNEQSYLPKATHISVKETEVIDLFDSPARDSTTPAEKDENVSQVIIEQHVKDSAEVIVDPSIPTPVRSLRSAASEDLQSTTTLDTPLEQNQSKTSKVPQDSQLKKVPQSTPRIPKKSKLQTFEAKVSKVLSSMLDEESRSSLEENQLTSLCSAQELNDSGWSIGMPWADMSSKYSFGVDSIEEESVSSLQLHDTSFTADSRTNTPDVQTQLIDNNNDINEDDESEEPSRYELELKDTDKVNKEGYANPCDTDSESEVGSIVEVDPPVKPPPLLVDISDGEYAPANEICENVKNDPSTSADVTVIFSNKQEHSSEVVEQTIDSSSDDDIVVLNVIDSSQTNNMPQKGRKRLSDSQIESNSSSDHIIPHKRSSHHEDTLLPGTSKPNKMGRFERWLYNPIKASKYLGHEKYLSKMSNNPSLWQLCRADVMQVSSPRGPKCTNCNEFGHLTRKCRVPRKIISCHMCGQPGHTETRCKEKMCLRCGTKNTVFTDRCRNCTNISMLCKICNAKTHVWKTCPDLWRRYHLTTSDGALTQPTEGDIRPQSEQWCSNCARRGHLSHMCSLPHWKCESISPYIRSYADVAAEENQFEGKQMFSMMLTDDAASALNTEQGNEILKSLSAVYNVEIHTSFDITYKKLRMKGSTLAVEEVRSRVLKWTSPKELASRNASLSTEAPTMNTIEAPSNNASKAPNNNASFPTEVSSKIACEAPTKNASEPSSKSPSEAFTKNSSLSAKNASTENPRKSLSLPVESPSYQDEDIQPENGVLSNIVSPQGPFTSSSVQEGTVRITTTKGNTSTSSVTGIGPTNQSGSPRLVVCDAWNLPPSLPKKFAKLEKLLESEMKFIDFPVYCNSTVKELYEKYLIALHGKSLSKRKDCRHYSRILSIILFGKCGFGDGPIHVAALRKVLQKVKERKGNILEIFKTLHEHFRPIFGGDDYNFKLFVELFYSDETLVKKYDGKRDDSQCVYDSSSQVDSNEGGEASGSEENNRVIDKPEIKLTSLKKTPKKQRSKKVSPHAINRIKRTAPFVIKNLASRFIFSSDRTSLERMYASFCKSEAHMKGDVIVNINRVISKLCKSYNIKLSTKL